MPKIGAILKLAGTAVVAAGIGVGATLGVVHFTGHPASAQAASAAAPAAAPPKPMFFANLSDVTVSIPPDTGEPATSYVEFGVQFATTDQTALTTFDELQPIIKSDIINLLMNETSRGLQDPQTRADLVKSCLDISNTVLARNANVSPAPFSNAYITNLVVQD
jgi:flagellar basal body-associated protein FliL